MALQRWVLCLIYSFHFLLSFLFFACLVSVCLAVVTTLAGSGTPAWVDGTGTAASLSNPSGVAFDAFGNALVAEPSNNRLRLVTPSGGTWPQTRLGIFVRVGLLVVAFDMWWLFGELDSGPLAFFIFLILCLHRLLLSSVSSQW